MHITYDESIGLSPSIESIEQYYCDVVLPKFGMTGNPIWERHVQTDPDEFLHIFRVNEDRYALVFADYVAQTEARSESFMRAMRLPDKTTLLHIQSIPDSRYVENITGTFALFHVTKDTEFDEYVDFLEVEYRKFRTKSDRGILVTVARDILQLIETAAHNHDTSALYSLQQLVDTCILLDATDSDVELAKIKEYIDILMDAEFGYEFHTEAEMKQARDAVYSELSRETRHTITASKYTAEHLGETVVLATAMYVKREENTTSGVSVSFIVDGDTFEYPMHHFLDDELKRYFQENAYINDQNIQHHLPEQIGEYVFVEGSDSVRRVFRRELGYIKW